MPIANYVRNIDRSGRLDRTALERRLGLRPSSAPEPWRPSTDASGVGARDWGVLAIACLAAAAPVLAPILSPSAGPAPRVAAAGPSIATPPGAEIVAAARADRGSAPLWAERRMAEANVVVLDAETAPPAIALAAGVIATGPVLADAATFPTASIRAERAVRVDEQPFPTQRVGGLEVPRFGPGASPFEFDQASRETLGIIDTGGASAPRVALGGAGDAPIPEAVLAALDPEAAGDIATATTFAAAPEAAPFALDPADMLDLVARGVIGGGAFGAERAAETFDVASIHLAEVIALAAATIPAQVVAERRDHHPDAPTRLAAAPTAPADPALSAGGAAPTPAPSEIAPPLWALTPVADPRRSADAPAAETVAAAGRPELAAAADLEAAADSEGAGASAEAAPPAAPRPAVSIVLTAVGLNSEASSAAFERLPVEVALSVAPIAADSIGWAQRTRGAGRVLLAETPMEPDSYPRVNPGPLTLLTTASVDENMRRLGETLARVPNADGVATYLGGRFAKHDTSVAALTAALQRRGLMLFETSPEPGKRLAAAVAAAGLPSFEAAVSIDRSGHARDVVAGLDELEAAARRDGYAVGVGVTIPSTVAGLATWLETLEAKGIDLRPLGPSGLLGVADLAANGG